MATPEKMLKVKNNSDMPQTFEEGLREAQVLTERIQALDPQQNKEEYDRVSKRLKDVQDMWGIELNG